MSIFPSRIVTTVVVVAAAATLPTTAIAMSVDMRSPDAKDAAAAAVGHTTPSTSDPVVITSHAIVQRDLRSPDARDAALRALRPVAATDAGFAWDDALVGGAGALGATLVVGGLVTVRHRRRPLGVA